MTNGTIQKDNLKVLKKNLYTPDAFKKNVMHENKACFSYNYKLWGCLETWDLAWDKLSSLPENENIFHELIIGGRHVKPYLDIEWYSEKFPNLDPDKVLVDIKEFIVTIFKSEWNADIKYDDMYIATCHRKKTEGSKKSFRVVISTHPNIVFKDKNCASYLAKKIRTLCSPKFDESLIDMAVYGTTQNIRFVGHSKAGEYVPMTKLNPNDRDRDFIITDIDSQYHTIDVPEQKDFGYKKIKNVSNVDFNNPESVKYILDKIKSVHTTAKIERIDANNFIQLNYDDRTEKCFATDTTHERIGFFCYIQGDLICLGCHSGNCVGENGTKIQKILGSLNAIKNVQYEAVNSNNTFDLQHNFIRTCVHDSSLGMSNLFEQMFLKPKRIKWINDTQRGSTFFWNGKLWQEDEYSFVDRLIASTLPKVLRKYIDDHEKLDIELSEDESKETSSLVKRLLDGTNITNVIKFLRPLINDFEFEKIKDIHPGFLSCKNGMVNLKTGELRQCVPEDNVTKSIDVDYDKDARMDEFDNFIKQITSSKEGEDHDLYNYIKWAIGYAMQGNPIKKLFFFLYGEEGYNGKSMLLNTIKSILSFYAVAMDKSVVVNTPSKSGGSHSTEICQLENSRIGILSETKEEDVINDGQIKTLTGITDKLSVREIYGKQKEFTPTFVSFISSNHKLKINLKDRAMYERLVLIPFRLSFVENPDPEKDFQRLGDPNLSEKFSKNKEGILRWVIEASMYYHNNIDMKLPETIVKAKEEYRIEMDEYADFMDTCIIKTGVQKEFVLFDDVISRYKDYCSENNIRYEKKKSEKMILDCFNSDKGIKKFTGYIFK